MIPYCAAKGGVESFTRSLGCEIAKYGINVNCVAPGMVITKIISRYSEKDLEGFRRMIPAGFIGYPENNAPMIVFLADVEKSKYIVGQTIAVDGRQLIDGVIDSMIGEPF